MLRTPNIYGYLILESNPWRQLTLNVTGNLTGPMLVPHELDEPVLVKTPAFFVLNAQISYDFHIKLQQKLSESLPDRIVLQVTAGIRNITDSYQRDLDVGPTRDAGYIYGPMMPRSVYLGVNVSLP